MVGKSFNCLKSSLAVLIDLLPQTKPSTLPTVKSRATQIQHLDFFSDKALELIDLNQRTALPLGLVDWYCPAAWTSQRERVLWCTPRILPMALSQSPTGYSFWACSLRVGSLPLRSVWRVSTSLAAVALSPSILAKEDVVWMSAVRTLHR